jgi:hypothetical protein
MHIESNESNRVKEVMVDTRINKVLALRSDSVVMLEALNSISGFYDTSKANLRTSKDIALTSPFLIDRHTRGSSKFTLQSRNL